MVARLVLWSLADTAVTVADLCDELPYDTRETWFFDEGTERVGSFAVFATADDAAEPLPERLRELIGKEPDIFELFDTA